MDIAFNEYNAFAVHNTFEVNRKAAYKTHIKAGFKLVKESDVIYDLIIKKDWHKNKLCYNLY